MIAKHLQTEDYIDGHTHGDTDSENQYNNDDEEDEEEFTTKKLIIDMYIMYMYRHI